MSPGQKKYFAGALDFRGKVRRFRRDRWVLCMIVPDLGSAELLKRYLGGTVSVRGNKKRQTFMWAVYEQKEIYKILVTVEPRHPKMKRVALDLYEKFFG